MDRQVQQLLNSAIIPALSTQDHKGSCGRIAVIGGSEDYTGAPYLCAMSALRCGADLAYVLCPNLAATPIKAYSPDLVVRPIFEGSRLNELCDAITRCHCVVIGPGLGPAPAAHSLATKALLFAVERGIPVVVDADGISIFANDLQLLSAVGPSDVVLTPNANEWRKLLAAANSLHIHTEEPLLSVCRAAKVSVFLKGQHDQICTPDGLQQSQTSFLGSMRRVGGQGDVLTGILSAFLAWRHIEIGATRAQASPSLLGALFAASCVMRMAQRLAFETPNLMRGYIASDLPSLIPRALHEILHVSKI